MAVTAKECAFVAVVIILFNHATSQENKTLSFPDDKGEAVEVRLDCGPQPEAITDPETSVRFHLYRRLEEKQAEIQMKIGEPLPSIFLKKADTKILIHGFINSLQCMMIQDIKDAYLDRKADSKQINVIAVDWGDLAGLSVKCYLGPKRNTIAVGQYVGKFIDHLVEQGAIDLEKLHLIGHSLGAHLAGVAGSHVKSGNISRITGLDPAGVWYGSDDESSKLDKSDANFVDVIHSNTKRLGYKDPCGHVDFYPHGGGHQPGCSTFVCSHSRAHVYFKESINNERIYPAVECASLDDVMTCSADIVFTEQGCTGCQSMSSNFMGILASPQEDVLYFASPELHKPEAPVSWTGWGIPVIGTVVVGAAVGLWWWRRTPAHGAGVGL